MLYVPVPPARVYLHQTARARAPVSPSNLASLTAVAPNPRRRDWPVASCRALPTERPQPDQG
ncbi:hypothetical protein LY76DRAFT_598579 [Colletotrichum caudatum]|nr:hypothetical protein LY76DRAFT_598579 [Colletotrichum caudatum]